jgi:NAD/NADP transhydrogenase beta subunit
VRTRNVAVMASLVTGAVLELGIGTLSGRREAWDSGLYWSIGLPAALLVAAAVGYLAGRREWYWTSLIVPSQLTVMLLRNGEMGGLWPLMVILGSVLGLPFLLVAFVASRFARPAEKAHAGHVGRRPAGDL